MWISNAAHSQEIDRRAIHEYGIPSATLMERAGEAVYQAAHKLLPKTGKLVVVCGKGNNGGDGFVVARLAHCDGYRVKCLCSALPIDLRQECHAQMLQAQEQGVPVYFPNELGWNQIEEKLSASDLVIDAILGTGTQGQVTGTPARMIEAVNRSGTPVLSIDIPSGIETDTGRELGLSVQAARTVTFGNPKPCFFQGAGLERSGDWTVAPIGFPEPLLQEPTPARLIDQNHVAAHLPRRPKAAHKGSNGSVLIVAGSHAMRGAAALSAQAAIRAGAGLVAVAAIESVCQTVMLHCPEATLLPLPESQGTIDPSAAQILLDHQSRFQASLFGPGLSLTDNILELLRRVWPDWNLPACLDADALNALAQEIPAPGTPSVLTPHPGEMARLLNTTVAEVQNDRFATVAQAAQKFRQTVLLKGPHTLVASPDEPTHVNQTGNPGMASAGMGDVLSGVVTTLLAQNLSPHQAATCGMFWHGHAGDICAQTVAPVGFTARDVAQTLPQARKSILEPS